VTRGVLVAEGLGFGLCFREPQKVHFAGRVISLAPAKTSDGPPARRMPPRVEANQQYVQQEISVMDFGAGIRKLTLGALAISSFLLAGGATPSAAQAAKRPNILVIMGDDVGWFNIGAYHRGIMSGKTPTSTSWRRRA
jgi:hypothetical protein